MADPSFLSLLENVPLPSGSVPSQAPLTGGAGREKRGVPKGSAAKTLTCSVGARQLWRLSPPLLLVMGVSPAWGTE